MVNRAQRRRERARNKARILYQSPDIDPAQADAILRRSAATDAVSDGDRD
jgi:hypothetical protein